MLLLGLSLSRYLSYSECESFISFLFVDHLASEPEGAGRTAFDAEPSVWAFSTSGGASTGA